MTTATDSVIPIQQPTCLLNNDATPSNLLNSNENFEIDDNLQLDVMHIVVAKAIADDHPQVKSIKDSRNPLQKTLAQQLQEEARVPPGPCGLDQIKLFEIILCDYQFVVISAEHGHPIVHKGLESNKQIKLLMHDGHFNVVTKLPGFLGSNYYCLR